jgi:hypothetical protein
MAPTMVNSVLALRACAASQRERHMCVGLVDDQGEERAEDRADQREETTLDNLHGGLAAA